MDFLGCKLCDGLDKLACIWLQLSLIYIVCEIEGGRGGGHLGGLATWMSAWVERGGGVPDRKNALFYAYILCPNFSLIPAL